MDNQFQLLFQAILDTKKIDIKKLQKELDKMPVEIRTKIDTASTTNDLKVISKQLVDFFNQTYNLNINESDAINAFRKIQDEALKATKVVSEFEKFRFQNQINAWNRINSNANKFHSKMEDIISLIYDADDITFTNLNKQFNALVTQSDISNLSSKTTEFKSAFEQLSVATVGSDVLKYFVDLGTTGVNAFNSLTKATTPLGALSVLSDGKADIATFIKNLDWLNCRATIKIA